MPRSKSFWCLLWEITYRIRVVSYKEFFRHPDGSRYKWFGGSYMEIFKDSVNLDTVEFQVGVSKRVSGYALLWCR